MRIKRGVHHVKRRKNILKKTKGFEFGRKNLIAAAKTAILHAGRNAFRGRKQKKRVNKGLWNIRINAGLKAINPEYSYSTFIHAVRTKNMELDRKVLSQLAGNNPEVFAELVKQVM